MKSPNASTGPRSAEGKARSSMNAVKTGIYSKSLVIPGEDRSQLDTLTEEYYQRFQPAQPEQRDQVDILVRSTWTLRRLATAEAQIWNYQMDRFTDLSDDAPLGQVFRVCDQTLTRLQRIVTSNQRNYRDALHELERLQSPDIPPKPALDPEALPQPTEKEPVNRPTEFVSSASTSPPPALPKTAKKPSKNIVPFRDPAHNCSFQPTQPGECPIPAPLMTALTPVSAPKLAII